MPFLPSDAPVVSDSGWALVADIGGSNIRLAIAHLGHAMPYRETVCRWPVRDFPGPAAAIDSYLAELAARGLLPERHPACIAICAAGPVKDGQVVLTNHPWRVDLRSLVVSTGAASGLLLNDAQATALAIPRLTEAAARPIGSDHPDAGLHRGTRRPAALISPGTGLGVATLFPSPTTQSVDGEGQAWTVIAGEGGHVTMPPCTDREAEVIRRVRFLYNQHASGEKLISGAGLQTIYETLHILDGRPAITMPPAEITAAARVGQDATAVEAIEMFCVMTATLAGNLALTFGAAGGVYVGGGILAQHPDMLDADAFRERFEAKGRFRGYMRAIPTFLITDPDIALAGLAMAAAGRGHCV